MVCTSRKSGAWPGDIGVFEFVDDVVRRTLPDYVFHLAARSSTAHEALWDNQRAISGGTWNVCEATARHCPEARVFITGSGLQFENNGEPLDERWMGREAKGHYAWLKGEPVSMEDARRRWGV